MIRALSVSACVAQGVPGGASMITPEQERILEAAYALGCEEVIEITPHPPACCCPNQGEPDSNGLQIRNAGCRVHKLRDWERMRP